MNSRAACALVAAVGVLAGCATPSPPVTTPVERVAPAVVRPAAAPLVESPPLEPVGPAVAPGPGRAAVGAPTVSEPVTQPAVSPATTEPTDEQQLASALSDLQRYGAMNADEIRREQNVITQLLARQHSDFDRIRLAVLHTLAKTAQDDQRAMQLLDSVVKNSPGSVAAKQLAAVVQVQVAERMRAVRDEQQKADTAIKKLEALRNMERDLLRDRIRSGGGGAGGGGSSGGGGG